MGNEVSLANEGTSIENDLSITWKEVKPCCHFPARQGPAFCTIGNKLYIFGGVIQTKDEVRPLNDLLCFDCDNEKWTLCEAKGQIPDACSGSAMSAVGNKLYVFGGLSSEIGWCDTLSVYDTETSTWSSLKGVGKAPCPRDKLASVAIGTSIYYFGGFGPLVEKDEDEAEAEPEPEPETKPEPAPENGSGPPAEEEDVSSDDQDSSNIIQQNGVSFTWYNDLFVYDTEKNTWSQPMHMNLCLPTGRAAMTLCAKDKDIYIFGGRDAKKRRNDIYVYNVDSRKWTKLEGVHGRVPSGRSYHTANMLGNRMIVMGGRDDSEVHYGDVHVLDIGTGQWLQPNVSGDIPSARSQHAVGLCGNNFVLYGGAAKYDATSNQCQELLADTYICKTDSLISGRSITPEAKEKDAA